MRAPGGLRPGAGRTMLQLVLRPALLPLLAVHVEHVERVGAGVAEVVGLGGVAAGEAAEQAPYGGLVSSYQSGEGVSIVVLEHAKDEVCVRGGHAPEGSRVRGLLAAGTRGNPTTELSVEVDGKFDFNITPHTNLAKFQKLGKNFRRIVNPF